MNSLRYGGASGRLALATADVFVIPDNPRPQIRFRESLLRWRMLNPRQEVPRSTVGLYSPDMTIILWPAARLNSAAA
jgi:hypothetical protein